MNWLSVPHDRGLAGVGGRLWVPNEVEASTFLTRSSGAWLSGNGALDQAQRNSVSFNQMEWSNVASLRATAILARLGPLASAIFLPQV